MHTKLQIQEQQCTPSYRFRNSNAHQATNSGTVLHTKLQIQGQFSTPSYKFRDSTPHQATNSGTVLHTKLQIRPSVSFLVKLFAVILPLDVA